jgi:hypothetical protein
MPPSPPPISRCNFRPIAKGGVVSYLEVITAQTTALADQRAAMDILRRRLAANVLVIKALGGANASSVPTVAAQDEGSYGRPRP